MILKIVRIIIKDVDIYINDILLDEKLYENISFYDISYKTSTRLKTLSNWSDKRWIY